MRQPEPRWRKDRKAWVCRIQGRLHTLAHGKENKQEAWKALRGILANIETQSRVKGETMLFQTLADRFLDWCQREKEPKTYEWYRYMLNGFCSFKKGKRARDLIPQDLNDWFAKGDQKFTAGTRSRAIEAVARVMNWGVKNKIMRENPLKGMERPAKPRREITINAAQRSAIFDAYKEGDCFRDFLFAMEQSGCRPGEIAKLTSENLALAQGVWIFTKHKTRNQTGGKPRVIYLSDPLMELSKKLVASVPPGTPLFRNSKGVRWTLNAVRLRLGRVRKRLKIPGLVAYLFRHGFITQALERGISDAVVAALAGHKDTRMIHAHYSHLTDNVKLLREAANKAVKPDESPGQ
jgi:integrase